jgi:hypothetical protein
VPRLTGGVFRRATAVANRAPARLDIARVFPGVVHDRFPSADYFVDCAAKLAWHIACYRSRQCRVYAC